MKIIGGLETLFEDNYELVVYPEKYLRGYRRRIMHFNRLARKVVAFISAAAILATGFIGSCDKEEKQEKVKSVSNC